MSTTEKQQDQQQQDQQQQYDYIPREWILADVCPCCVAASASDQISQDMKNAASGVGVALRLERIDASAMAGNIGHLDSPEQSRAMFRRHTDYAPTYRPADQIERENGELAFKALQLCEGATVGGIFQAASLMVCMVASALNTVTADVMGVDTDGNLNLREGDSLRKTLEILAKSAGAMGMTIDPVMESEKDIASALNMCRRAVRGNAQVNREGGGSCPAPFTF